MCRCLRVEYGSLSVISFGRIIVRIILFAKPVRCSRTAYIFLIGMSQSGMEIGIGLPQIGNSESDSFLAYRPGNISIVYVQERGINQVYLAQL